MNDSDPKPALIGSRAWICIAVLIFASLIFLERCHTYTQAADRDMAGYAIIGHEMLRGRLLYTDLWERKPPLLYATFAAAELLCGYGPHAIFLLNISAAMLTLIFICLAVGGGSRRSWIAIVFAGGFWVLIGGDLYAQANQPNAEVFINVLMTAAFALLLRAPDRGHIRFGVAILLGALFAAATMYKHHAIIPCGFLLAGHVFFTGRKVGSVSSWVHRLGEAVVASLVIGIAWGALIGYFAIHHRLDDLIEVLYRQNASYAIDIAANLRGALIPIDLFVEPMIWAIPLSILLGLAMVQVIARNGGQPKFLTVPSRIYLLVLWIIGTWLMIAVPGMFIAHYYQLLMPPVCIACGWAAASLLMLDRAPSRRMSNFMRTAVVAIAVGYCAWTQLRQYELPPSQWIARAFQNVHYFNNDFTFQRQLGENLSKLLAPDETFWNFGEDNTLYFSARRSPPTGLLYMNPLVTGDETQRYWTHLMADLNRRPPDLIVISLPSVQGLPPTMPIFSWIRAHYVPAPTGDLGSPIYQLLVRRNSKLAARLHGSATTVPARDTSAGN